MYLYGKPRWILWTMSLFASLLLFSTLSVSAKEEDPRMKGKSGLNQNRHGSMFERRLLLLPPPISLPFKRVPRRDPPPFNAMTSGGAKDSKRGTSFQGDSSLLTLTKVLHAINGQVVTSIVIVTQFSFHSFSTSTLSRTDYTLIRTTRTIPTPFPTSTTSLSFTILSITNWPTHTPFTSTSSTPTGSTTTAARTPTPFYHRNRVVVTSISGSTTDLNCTCNSAATFSTFDPSCFLLAIFMAF